MEYSIYDAVRTGIDRLIFVVQPDTDPALLERWFRRYSSHADVKFAFQGDDISLHSAPRTRPWGTVHALLMARPLVSGPFGVLNADDFYGREAVDAAFRFLDQVTPEAPQVAVLGYRLENTVSSARGVNRAILRMDQAGRLRSIAEARQLRPGEEDRFTGLEDGATREYPGDTLISMNLWAFTPAIFPLLERSFAEFVASGPGPDQEYVLPEAIDRLLQQGAVQVQVIPTRSIGCGLTHPDDKPQVAATLRRRVQAGEYPQVLWEP